MMDVGFILSTRHLLLHYRQCRHLRLPLRLLPRQAHLVRRHGRSWRNESGRSRILYDLCPYSMVRLFSDLRADLSDGPTASRPSFEPAQDSLAKYIREKLLSKGVTLAL